MKKTNVLFAAILCIALFSSCDTTNDNGQAIISFSEAFAACWRLDFWYAAFSILSGIALGVYIWYISNYKDWEAGTIIIGMFLLGVFLGLTFGQPITTHLNTTVEAAGRGNYVM